MNLLGLKIITSNHLTKSETVERSWRERLWSWPWRPWKKTRVVVVPDEEIYVLGSTIYCHPIMLTRLQTELDSFGSQFNSGPIPDFVWCFGSHTGKFSGL